MLVPVPELLNATDVLHARELLESVDWNALAGDASQSLPPSSEHVSLPESHPVARRLTNTVLRHLSASALVTSAALPRKLAPPLFSRCVGRSDFGVHAEAAMRYSLLPAQRVRSDVCVVLFLSAPEQYEGGEITVDDTYGTRTLKLSAGDAILFPTDAACRVARVTGGTCFLARACIQSMVREQSMRQALFDLDNAIQEVNRDVPRHASTIRLTGVYHNLLRRWAEL